MANPKTINVYCQNRHLLFERYNKVKRGRLIKCYFDQIRIDHVGVSDLTTGKDIFCPFCQREGVILRIGRVATIHGRLAVKPNHGGTKPLRT